VEKGEFVLTHLMKFLLLLHAAIVDNVHLFSVYCVCDGGVILCKLQRSWSDGEGD
jgi:hypothetical protein